MIDLASVENAVVAEKNARIAKLELALKLRDDEVAWFEREVETLREGRRVKLRSTANERAWLAANKFTMAINVNAYTLALDLAEDLEAQLVAVTAARDDACAMLEATFTELSALVARVANSPLRAAVADDDWRAVMASHDEGIALATAQIAALRAVGKVVTP